MIQKKQTPWGLYIIALIIILMLSYIASGLFVLEDVTLLNIQDKLRYLCLHPWKAWNDNTPAIMAFGMVLWFFFVSYCMMRFRNFYLDIEHGRAQWADVAEVCNRLSDRDDKNNRLLSRNLSVSLKGPLPNNNMLVIGSSGDAKTTGIMHPNLCKFQNAYVVLDVKGDTQRKLGNAFKQKGYVVKSINFKEPEKSDRYNPFVYIKSEKDIIRIIHALHEACRPKKDANMADPFWDDAVKLWLQALFYAAWLEAREKNTVATLNDVIRFANMEYQMVMDPFTGEEISKLQQYMNQLERKYGAVYPPVRDYKKLKEGAPETVGSVKLMLSGMLKICDTAEVKRIFEANDIDIRELGTGVGGDPSKRIILFLCIPDNMPDYNWIISMFYTQMFDVLIDLSDVELKRPLPVTVEVFLDEFYSGAKPADPLALLGVVRSRNMIMNIFLQSQAQVKALFGGDKKEIIFDNISTLVFLGSGPGAAETHKWISELLGKITVDTVKDGLTGQGGNRMNYDRVGIELMTPDAVATMPLTDAIILLKGEHPIYDEKIFPFDRPELNYVADKRLKKLYADALALGDYEHPVYTVYDPVNFKYITVERSQSLIIVTDKEDIKTMHEAAAHSSDIYTYNIEESELLYLSWGKEKYTQEEMEALFKQALEKQEKRREELKGLFVLQDVEEDVLSVPKFGTIQETDKSNWDKNSSLQLLLQEHWEELSGPEQEEFCLALDDGLTEEQLKELLFCSITTMENMRRAFVVENYMG